MKQGKVLIVDDAQPFRRALGTTLSALGFEIAEATNGEQALAYFDANRCDVVLLDVDMPGMGGVEACRELRRRDSRLQIIMLTVREGQEDKLVAFDAGADDYVTKPFALPDLLARLKAAIRRSGTTPTIA